MFKVYKRKIHVYLVQNSNVKDSEHQGGLIYAHSTNASKTCKDAVKSAKEKFPAFEFKAWFAKD